MSQTPTHALPSYLNADDLGPWGNYLQQVDRVTPYLGSLARWVETLKRPKRSLIVDVPIELDNGKIAHFEGYRVQHNTSRGGQGRRALPPGRDALRSHGAVGLDVDQERRGEPALRRRQGGIRVDPRTLSLSELERVTRRYTSEIGVIIGPSKDIPAPDVNTNAQTMAWMMDTYSMNEGSTATGVVTGKPIALGGSLGRVEATGRGVFVVGCEAARDLNINVAGARVVVQGFGNVGGTAARLFHEAGAKVIAAQDHTGTVHNAAGLDVHKLLSHVSQHGGVGGFTGGQAMDKNEFWTLETEFLIPAALESQITAANAAKVRAKIVVEGANGPTTPEADDILFEHGVYVVPDVLANAGGVTVSYFEWVQDFSSFFWSEDEINQRLERIMREAYAGVSQVAREHKVTLRTAAFIVACTRILQARQVRGLYP